MGARYAHGCGMEGRELEPVLIKVTDTDVNKDHRRVGLETIRTKVLMSLLPRVIGLSRTLSVLGFFVDSYQWLRKEREAGPN